MKKKNNCGFILGINDKISMSERVLALKVIVQFGEIPLAMPDNVECISNSCRPRKTRGGTVRGGMAGAVPGYKVPMKVWTWTSEKLLKSPLNVIVRSSFMYGLGTVLVKRFFSELGKPFQLKGIFIWHLDWLAPYLKQTGCHQPHSSPSSHSNAFLNIESSKSTSYCLFRCWTLLIISQRNEHVDKINSC